EDDPEFTYQVTEGSLAGVDLNLVLTRVAGEDVGSYAIILPAGSVNTTNYKLTYAGANLQINARPITVTADPKNKVYGEGDPTLTYTVGGMGLAPGDSLALTRAAGENVGSYAITIAPGPVTGTNYARTYNGALLAITPAPTMTVLTT